MNRADAIATLKAAEDDAERAIVAMSDKAAAWAAAQQAANAAWLAFVHAQNDLAQAQLAQQRARLALARTATTPAADPMGRRVQA